MRQREREKSENPRAHESSDREDEEEQCGHRLWTAVEGGGEAVGEEEETKACAGEGAA